MNQQDLRNFQKTVWEFYKTNKRDMPWRKDMRPYYVLVSELMLQQTQVVRVVPKFEAFVKKFPDFEALAKAPLSSVLAIWIGLGYNRRARFLHASAQRVVEVFCGELPDDRGRLESLPGIGPNTAGALLAYAFNQPVIFVETNIRTVYLHHFFAGKTEVSDKDIIPLLEATIDKIHPREWYWALMDYGTYLKATNGNNISRSKHYKKQSPLKGSLREMRGEILRQLNGRRVSAEKLEVILDDPRFLPALEGLKRDGLVEETGGVLYLTGGSELR